MTHGGGSGGHRVFWCNGAVAQTAKPVQDGGRRLLNPPGGRPGQAGGAAIVTGWPARSALRRQRSVPRWSKKFCPSAVTMSPAADIAET